MTVLLDSTPPKGRATPKDKGPTASQPGKVYPLIEAKVIFFKSRFPMNTSGKTIKAAHRSFSVPKPNIIILHDDLSRPFPRISHKFSGSANGHNGVRSLTVSLNTEEFHRIRVGIGRPVDGEEVADYVLGRLGEEEVKACQWPEKWGTELPGRFVRGNGGGVTALEKGKVEQGAVLDAVWREIERLMVADEVQ